MGNGGAAGKWGQALLSTHRYLDSAQAAAAKANRSVRIFLEALSSIMELGEIRSYNPS